MLVELDMKCPCSDALASLLTSARNSVLLTVRCSRCSDDLSTGVAPVLGGPDWILHVLEIP